MIRCVELDGYGTFELPAYMVRIDHKTDHGWQVRPPGLPTKWFSDSRHGDPIKSFTAAQKFLQNVGAPQVVDRLKERERETKLHPLGIPGVFIQFKSRKGRSVREVQLLIPRPDKSDSARVLYVGTERNWEGRLDTKIEKAREIRDQFEDEWRKKNRQSRPVRKCSGPGM